MDPDNLRSLWNALVGRDFYGAARFLGKGAALDDLIGEDGDTLLHQAAQNGDTEMVEFFLSHDCPLTLETFDYVHQTPLIRAAVSLLLRAGADPTIPGWMGMSAVDLAWHQIQGTPEDIGKIRDLVRDFPSSLRDRLNEQNKAKEIP